MESHEQLVAHLQRTVLRTPAIAEALKRVDRKGFVPTDEDAYADRPLPIGHGQTISQPTTVAFMLELLQPGRGQRILDVGTGSGWTTALLAAIVGPKGVVRGVELVPELVALGRENLRRAGIKNATIAQAGQVKGLPDEAPFDRILVSAAAETLPQELVDQLRVGGVMVIPIQDAVWRIEKGETGSRVERHQGFAFVPLR